MAKVTAPLLGFGASGQIAKTAVYSTWRGVKYARQHVVPANPNTAAQQTTRSVFANLREIFKRLEADAIAPWDSFATGRAFVGMNAFVGENLRLIRGDNLFTDFEGSPGARGGLAYPTLTPGTGSVAGDVSAGMTAPTLPTGWTITKAVAMAFPDQDPESVFVGPIVIGTDATSTYSITLSGLGTGVSCILTAWFVYEKPDGTAAYSPSKTATQTSHA